MEVLRLLFFGLIVAFALSQIVFGLRVMKTREYVGKRAINLFKREEYRLTGDAAYTIGISYVAGCSLILFAFVVIIPIGLWVSIGLANILFPFLFAIGIMILVVGNLMAWLHSSQSK